MSTYPALARRHPRWPDRATVAAYGSFLLVFNLLFAVAYFGTQLIAPPPRPGFHLYFGWESSIPLIPWMIWPYFSLITAFGVPAVQFEPAEIDRLNRRSVFCLVAGGACFLVLPCVSGFPQAEIDGFYGTIFGVLRALDTPQNLVPSLHVAFGALILMHAASVAGGVLRYFYLTWLIVLTASVLLVHQHHVADVVAGYALAAISWKLFPP